MGKVLQVLFYFRQRIQTTKNVNIKEAAERSWCTVIYIYISYVCIRAMHIGNHRRYASLYLHCISFPWTCTYVKVNSKLIEDGFV